VPEAKKLILNLPLVVYNPHDLRGILNSKGELWLSDSHLLKYQVQLLGGTEITLRTCQSLNPASLLLEAEGNPEHSCEEVFMENYAAQLDLTDWPLKNLGVELYTDSSSFVKNGVRHAGFVVVTEFGILKSGPLPPNTSIQLAELVALTEALKLTKTPQRVNICTDSKYAFMILHAHAAICKEREILIATEKISHNNKREVTLIILGITALVSALAGISYGVIVNHVTAKNLTKVAEDNSDQVGLAIKDIQRSLSFLACMVMDHLLALDFLLTKQGGVCAIANTSCCTYINTSDILEERADYILQ
jgi:ribonuclease HI